jgi:cardiolipin synthase
MVMDGEYAYMGGMNIGDEYACEDSQYTCWRDAQLELGGPAVAALHAIFLNDLAACCGRVDLVETVRKLPLHPIVPEGPAIPAQIIASGPDTPWDTIHKAYLSVISRARKTLWMTTPYLVCRGTHSWKLSACLL